MKIKDFEKELQQKYPSIQILANPNRPGLANVFLNGEDICPVPDGEIKDESDPTYFYEFPNGMMGRHNSKADVYAKLDAYIKWVESEKDA
jgi:hypothetical protein